MKTTHHFERLGKRLLGKNKVCWGGKEGLGRISKLKQVFSCLFFSFVHKENWCYPAELAVNFQQKRRVSFCLQVDPRLSPNWCFQKGRILKLNRKTRGFRDLPVKLKRSAGARSADRDNRQAEREVKKVGRWRPTRKYPTSRACGCARANPTQLELSPFPEAFWETSF